MWPVHTQKAGHHALRSRHVICQECNHYCTIVFVTYMTYLSEIYFSGKKRCHFPPVPGISLILDEEQTNL